MKIMMYDSWNIKCKEHFFVILGHFCPLTLLTIQKIKFWKNKKSLEILSFYTCALQTMIKIYGSWDIEHDRQISGLFFAFLSPPPTSPKNENENKNEKKKKCLEISSFYTTVSKIMIICCTVPEIWQVIHVIFHFWLFFALLLHKQPQIWKFLRYGTWHM